MKKIFLILLLSVLLINNAFAKKLQTNIKNVFWKNPTIGYLYPSVTIVNNSSVDVDYVTINFFDADGDQIKTCNRSAFISRNSGDTVTFEYCGVSNIRDRITKTSVRVRKLK